MKLNNLKFKNIRNFQGEVEFDFSKTQSINTISGKNGSGKTTVFKSILLCQKIFFAKQLENNAQINNSIKSELSKYFTAKDSSIEITFLYESDTPTYAKFKIICDSYENSSINYSIEISAKDADKILESWNLNNPLNIIVYIDSDKHFFEEDIKHSNISVSTSGKSNLIIDSVLNPEKIVSNIYQRIINDYLIERLVPSKPRQDLYFIPTKILLKELLPNINLSNFSGKHFNNQFVLLGRANPRGKEYDIRNFSSGEKSIFYILLFINYVDKVGLLIIDEPENHFHEELLVKFIKVLSDITLTDNYGKYIVDTAKKNSIKLERTERDILNTYGRHYLSQMFLLTHSKNVIYNNFSNNTNFYIENELKQITYDEHESTLRKLGLSSVYSKVLFVEGTDDNEFIEKFLNDYNIKVQPLKGSGQVIETFKKIANVKDYVRQSHFCFLIDRDTRNQDDINKIRELNEKYFDDSFIVLDRHEFENYLLEEDIFAKVYNKHAAIFAELETANVDNIRKILLEQALKQRPILLRKSIKILNEQSLNSFNKDFIKKDIPVDSLQEYEDFYDKKFSTIDLNFLLKQMYIENYKVCVNKYSESSYRKDWKQVCDGKTVLSLTCSIMAKKLHITKDRLKSDLKQVILNHPEFEVNKVIAQIIRKFSV